MTLFAFETILLFDFYRFNRSEFYTLEKEAVFKKNWIAVGRIDQVQQPGQYFTGQKASWLTNILSTPCGTNSQQIFSWNKDIQLFYKDPLRMTLS